MPQSNHSPSRFAALGALIAAFLLTGCGRKGPLDLPPTASVQKQEPGEQQPTADSGQSGIVPQQSSPRLEYGADGRPQAPRGQKKKLPGDILID